MSAPHLRIESGEDRGRELLLSRPLVVGRATGCDFVLNDESCSRMHVRITPTGDRGRVEDLGSTNGTLVNGERVSVAALEEGDTIMIGGTVLRFHRPRFDGGATVVLANAARADSSIVAELAADEPPAESPSAGRVLEATISLVEGMRGRMNRQTIARSLCRSLNQLLNAERSAVLLFRPASPDPRDAQLISIPDMRLDTRRPWIHQSLNSRQALLLQEPDKVKQPLYGLVIPVFHGPGPQLLVYSDRRAEPFLEEDLSNALQLVRTAAILHESTLAHQSQQDELIEHRSRFQHERRIVGESPAHQQSIAAVRRNARGLQPVLFIGETGTGKELLARLLHNLSPRSAGPFITVNCSATPEDLLRNEILGDDAGDDGRRLSDRDTALERAHGGTIFLDEIDAMDLPSQARLAATLRARKLTSPTGDREMPIDVRLVAASDRDLSSQAQSGSFHEDLLALLAMGTIPVPALRERLEDIPLLADHFLKRHTRLMNRVARRLSREALHCLLGYLWPGNVRELSNVIERAVMLSIGEEIGVELLPFQPRPVLDATTLSLAHAEKLAIDRALKHCEYKKGKAAEILGISWPTLNKKVNDYGIEIPARGRSRPSPQ